MKQVILLGCCLLFGANLAFSQQQLGLRLDNYSGINAALFNPAAPVTSPHAWDLNLLEGAAFFANNYAFFRNASWPEVSRTAASKFALAIDDRPENPLPADALVLDFYDDSAERYLYSLASVMGPSFYFRLGNHHQLGLISRARLIGSAKNIDNDFSYYRYFNRRFFDEFSVDPFQLNMLAVSELGLNYALTLPTANGSFSIGVNARMVMGYEGGYGESARRFDLSKLPGDSLIGSPIRFDVGYTYSGVEEDIDRPQVNGRGAGFDLGAIYTIGGENPADYRFKIGFALTDIGGVRFNSFARRHQAITDTLSIIPGQEFRAPAEELPEIEPTIRYFSQKVLGDSSATLSAGEFSMGLPTAFNLQLDVRVGDLFFVGATYIQGIPLNGRSGHQGSLLALSPRLEHRWFGLSTPVSLFNGSDFRMGLALRLAIFHLGTDDLGGLLGQTRLNSGDAYFAVKFNPLLLFGAGRGEGDSGGGKQGGSKGKTKGGRKEPGCYRF